MTELTEAGSNPLYPYFPDPQPQKWGLNQPSAVSSSGDVQGRAVVTKTFMHLSSKIEHSGDIFGYFVMLPGSD